MEIQAGDTARLNSGGPTMSVQWVDEYGSAYCIWFDSKGLKQDGRFNVACLIKA